jgi:hypothetical protein
MWNLEQQISSGMPNLIEAVEKSICAEKEQFIDFLPKMIETIRKSQAEEHLA